ncbi:MAG: crossover junction endodeoxyribonuclease RuvC [Nitrospinota bacterium]|nr:crossover junction endodeoxyribonuclease RuvC [Nitrospinota bacterium]
MRVMGIDPGSQCTGYGVVEERDGELSAVHWDGIRCNTKAPFAQRLKVVYKELSGVLEEYRPDAVAVEEMFFAKNAQSALKLGQTRGVALLAVAHAELPIGEYAPTAVKQSVTGYGRAGKEQVQSMVVQLLKLEEPPTPLDASDALAIAICHIHSANLINRLKV